MKLINQEAIPDILKGACMWNVPKDWYNFPEDAAATPTLKTFCLYPKIMTLRVGPAPPVSGVDDG